MSRRASVRLYKVKEILARRREEAKSTETRCKPRWIPRTNGRTTCHEKSLHSHSIRGFWPFQGFRCHGIGKWRSFSNAKMQAKTPIQMFFLKIAKKLAYRRAFLKISPEFWGEKRPGRRMSPQHLDGNLEFTSTFLCGKLHFYSFFIHFLFIFIHILSHFCLEPRRNLLRSNEHLKDEPNVETARVYILQTTHRDRHGSMTPARDSENS